MLGLSNVEYAIGERVLFSKVTININPHDRFGLVGANGTGKTTLLKIISGELAPTSGAVSRAMDLQLGYLPQEEIVLRDNSLIAEVMKDYHRLLRVIAELEERIAQNPHSKNILKEYEIAQDNFSKIGAYDYEVESHKVLAGLGFNPEDYSKRMQEFSSGWQMRAVLARLLLNRPDLLLLDEPTNHLDIESIEWLESYLQNFKGAMVLVSHDRYFLDKILKTSEGTTGIWEIDLAKFRRYRTNYTGYLHESHAHKQKLMQMAKTQQRKIEDIKDFIARNKDNKSKAGVVKSREKHLEKMEIIEVEAERKKIRVQFPVEPIFSPQVVALKNVSKYYNGKVVFNDLNLTIKNGHKIALIGKNGAGKSTLCRIIAGIEQPTTGLRVSSEKLKIGAFSHEIMLQLSATSTVIDEALKEAPAEVYQNIRSYLGLFLFSGDDVFKKIEVLSGGEKTRLVMLKTMIKPSNLLILDEPTYHLDKDSVESIKQAITSYAGTIIFVTHERDLIAAFANRIIELKQGRLHDYPGDFAYYLWKRENPGIPTDRQIVGNSSTRDKRTKPVESPTEMIKKQILEKEARRSKLRITFSRPSMISNPRKSKKLFEEYERLTGEIEGLEKRLVDLGGNVPNPE